MVILAAFAVQPVVGQAVTPRGQTPQDKSKSTSFATFHDQLDATGNPFGHYTETIDETRSIIESIYAGQDPARARQEARRKAKALLVRIQNLNEQNFELGQQREEKERDLGANEERIRDLQDLLQQERDLLKAYNKMVRHFKSVRWDLAVNLVHDFPHWVGEKIGVLDPKQSNSERLKRAQAAAKAQRKEIEVRKTEIKHTKWDGISLRQDIKKIENKIAANDKKIAALDKELQKVAPRSPMVTTGGSLESFYLTTPGNTAPTPMNGWLVPLTQTPTNGDTKTQIRQLTTLGFSTGSIGGNRRLGVWLKTDIGGLDGNTTGAKRKGKVYKASAGITYRLPSDIVLGAALRYQKSKNRSGAINTVHDTDLVGIALSARFTLAKAYYLKLVAGYEHAWNDISVNGFTGTFGYDTFLISAELSRPMVLGKGWWTQPFVSVSFSTTDRDTYINSANRVIVGGTSNIGILSGGLRLGRRIVPHSRMRQSGLAALTPSLGLKGMWLFERPGDQVLTNGTNLPLSDYGLTIDGKLAFDFTNAMTANIAGSFTAMNRKILRWSLSGGLNIPLSGFGGDDRTAALLGLTATTHAMADFDAMASLRVPF